MKIEASLLANAPRVVIGVKGAKSRPFQKRFKNEAAQEAWFETDAARDVVVYEIRLRDSMSDA